MCLPVVFVRGSNPVRILPPGEASPVLAAASKRAGERKGNCSTNGDHDRAIPLAAFQVITYGRIAGDHRGESSEKGCSASASADTAARSPLLVEKESYTVRLKTLPPALCCPGR